MGQVSRPLIALLVGTVVFFAVWMVALRPSSSTGGGSGGRNAYDAAIAKAHQAVGISAAADAAHGGGAPAQTTASPSAQTTTSASTPLHMSGTGAQAAAGAAATGAHVSSTPSRTGPATSTQTVAAAQRRANLVAQALSSRHVIALLFYNPAAADDEAVKQELAAVPSVRRTVVKLAVPLDELSRYSVITAQVPVNESPTLVLIDRSRRAATIVGFADRFEIAARVRDMLAVR